LRSNAGRQSSAARKQSLLPRTGATRFELVVNLTMAKALGLTAPATLHARTDDLIE